MTTLFGDGSFKQPSRPLGSDVQAVRSPRILNDAYLLGVMDTNFLSAMALVRGFRQCGACAEWEVVYFLIQLWHSKGRLGGGLLCQQRRVGQRLEGFWPWRWRESASGLINCVAPGLVRTAMANRLQAALPSDQYQAVAAAHPLGLGDPAAAVVYLLSKAARWVTGTTLVVDGGYTAH